MNFQDNIFLIGQLVKGNEKAFSFLVKNYHKKLFIYAITLTNDQSMAEDIVQEVFMRTWEYRKKLNKGYSINGFLYKSVYNEFINIYHKKQAIMALEKTYITTLNEVVEETNGIDLEKKVAIISKEIEKLPKKCKETFLLSKKEGLTNIEIAEYLNVSIKSVEAHMTKAYSILRSKVKVKIKTILFLLFRSNKKFKLFSRTT